MSLANYAIWELFMTGVSVQGYGFNYVYHKPCSANRSKDDYSIEVMDDEIVCEFFLVVFGVGIS